ncbi:effector-associated constant component EACC1 [Streptomyces massasporeus]|uniref:effector-associated constant component EACC1 n=1 Tax=Streptomyces massasporeus TaxID=67324 RepID=UPI0037224196
MRFTLTCKEGTDDDVVALLEMLNRHAGGADLKPRLLAKSGTPGDMGVLHDAIAFASENRELIETSLTVFGAWLEARFQPSTWTVSNGRRTVQVTTTKIDRETLEALSALLEEDTEPDTD